VACAFFFGFWLLQIFFAPLFFMSLQVPQSNDCDKIVIITAPSGAGKTSITHHLLKQFPQLAFSISAATRPRRSYEKDGVDYYFMSVEDFQKKIPDNIFVEWEMVYEGKYYGTLKSELARIWKLHQIPLLDVDVKGALHLQEQCPGTTLSLFVEPPSILELQRRLESRGTESAESLQDRLNKVSYELSFKSHFNKIIINENLEEACRKASGFVSAFLDH
jgi:guanylate kinase